MEVTVFCKLILEVTSHHVYILLLRNTAPAHTQGEGITQECDIQEVGSLGTVLETASKEGYAHFLQRFFS